MLGYDKWRRDDLETLNTNKYIWHNATDEDTKKMANEARVKVTLVCTECKQRNYDTKKNKKNDPDRLELKKHCRFCKKHTLHRESK